MPEGKPLFPVEIADELERNGISLEDAEADFGAAHDAEATENGEQFRYGVLCIYRYRTLVVMRQPERLITKIWIVR